jgi:uncharacterized metal-binding protein YceD (DUF177 family)
MTKFPHFVGQPNEPAASGAREIRSELFPKAFDAVLTRDHGVHVAPMREFSHPVRIDPWPVGGVVFQLRAERKDRHALAERLDLEAVERFEAAGRIDRADDSFLLEGRLQADVVQICVVSLEPFVQRFDEEVRLVLRRDVGADDAIIDPDQADVIPIDGADVDLADIFAEELALRLDPHPRAPGGSLDQLEAPLDRPEAPNDEWRARLARQRQAVAG